MIKFVPKDHTHLLFDNCELHQVLHCVMLPDHLKAIEQKYQITIENVYGVEYFNTEKNRSHLITLFWFFSPKEKKYFVGRINTTEDCIDIYLSYDHFVTMDLIEGGIKNFIDLNRRCVYAVYDNEIEKKKESEIEKKKEIIYL